MSDTPRTDAEARRMADGLGTNQKEYGLVPTSLARQLERENKELLAALEAAIAANVAELPPNCRSIGDEPKWLKQSRAAIKKAKGC